MANGQIQPNVGRGGPLSRRRELNRQADIRSEQRTAGGFISEQAIQRAEETYQQALDAAVEATRAGQSPEQIQSLRNLAAAAAVEAGEVVNTGILAARSRGLSPPMPAITQADVDRKLAAFDAHVQSAGSPGPNIGAVDPAKFTPESIQRFSETGDFGQLEPIDEGRPLQEILSTEEGLRGEFTKLSGDFRDLNQKITTIRTAAQNPSAAGDLAIIFSFMKILDPTSVVREGEQASASDAAGVPDRVRALYNRLLTGERLAAEQRANFVSQADQIFNARRREQDELIRQFSEIARSAGVDPDRVIIDAFRPGGEPAVINFNDL